jgi:hypothetical protein
MKKYTIEEFADQIRSKYPNAYDDLEDNKLIKLWLKKFPDDEEKIIWESPSSTTKLKTKSYKKYIWFSLVFLLFIAFRAPSCRNNMIEFSKNLSENPENYIKQDGQKKGLSFGATSNYYFDELYLFEEDPKLESNKSIGYGLNLLYNGIYFKLSHWKKNTESLDIEDADKLKDFPVGHYTYNGESDENWEPFTIKNIDFPTSKFKSDSNLIISGTLDISKNAEEYKIDFQFEYNNGKVTSGHFNGPLSRFN